MLIFEKHFWNCNPQVEVQTQNCFWSDFPDQNYLWSDFPDRNYLWSDFPDSKCSDQTFQTEGVLIRPSPDHGPDPKSDHCPDLNQTMFRLKCARRGYDQTQLRSKHLWSDPTALDVIYDQTEARSKPVLIRLKCARNSLIRDRF